jgi:hypothetical protein
MRGTVNSQDDTDASIRQFANGFEFIFGDPDDEDDDEDESMEADAPLLGRSKSIGGLLNKTESSSLSGVSANRRMNSTFSYAESDPTLYRPKLHFMSTKDIIKILTEGSTDFLASRIRNRCRVLQRPEMWIRLLEIPKEESAISLADYEAVLYQLLEFRLVYEYINGGAFGEPFSNIKKMYPTDEEKWAKKEQQLSQMEAGGTETAEVVPVVAPRKLTKKKRLLEKLASNPFPASTAVERSPSPSSKSDLLVESHSEEDPDELLVEHHRRQKRLSSFDSTEVKSVIPVRKLSISAPVVIETEADDEWVHVGAEKPKKDTKSSPPVQNKNPSEQRPRLQKLSAKHMAHQFKYMWTWCEDSHTCEKLSVRMVVSRTFIHVESTKPKYPTIRECPF